MQTRMSPGCSLPSLGAAVMIDNTATRTNPPASDVEIGRVLGAVYRVLLDRRRKTTAGWESLSQATPQPTATKTDAEQHVSEGIVT